MENAAALMRLDDILEQSTERMIKSTYSLFFKIPEPQPCLADETDYQRAARVIANLLQNARERVKAGSIKFFKEPGNVASLSNMVQASKTVMTSVGFYLKFRLFLGLGKICFMSLIGGSGANLLVHVL